MLNNKNSLRLNFLLAISNIAKKINEISISKYIIYILKIFLYLQTYKCIK